ncbi:hypothetical protein MRB53_020115 [Persea americana]|uniref:Uncharacterized protein n=1 Tax=Persea americana TaxID=3435 RepID=A0ACC2L0C4_PERAE|nr:hypothetical protein MRB53_020115 [Persea americana]
MTNCLQQAQKERSATAVALTLASALTCAASVTAASGQASDSVDRAEAFPQYRDCASFGESTGWLCLGLGYLQLVSSATVSARTRTVLASVKASAGFVLISIILQISSSGAMPAPSSAAMPVISNSAAVPVILRRLPQLTDEGSSHFLPQLMDDGIQTQKTPSS